MRRGPIETSIGVIVVLLAIIFVVVAYNATDYRGESGYRLLAEFNKVGTIKTGSDVRVSGVPVGKVLGLSLDPETFKAKIILDIDNRFLYWPCIPLTLRRAHDRKSLRRTSIHVDVCRRKSTYAYVR